MCLVIIIFRLDVLLRRNRKKKRRGKVCQCGGEGGHYFKIKNRSFSSMTHGFVCMILCAERSPYHKFVLSPPPQHLLVTTNKQGRKNLSVVCSSNFFTANWARQSLFLDLTFSVGLDIDLIAIDGVSWSDPFVLKAHQGIPAEATSWFMLVQRDLWTPLGFRILSGI